LSQRQIAFARGQRRLTGYSATLYERMRPASAPRWPGQKGLRPWQDGLFIAVVGPDGAGKSTLVDYLEGWLGELFDTRRVYLGKGDIVSSTWQGLAKLKWKMIGQATGREPARSREDTNAQTASAEVASDFDVKRSAARQRLWELSRIAQASRQLRKVELIRHQRRRGLLILTDRFPHPSERFAGGPGIIADEGALKWTHFAARTEQELLDKIASRTPDLMIRLAISAEEAHRRKPDHHFGDIRRKVEAMEHARWSGVKMQVIDATLPVEEVQRQARQMIWRLLSR
jgi:thymidylate kinase